MLNQIIFLITLQLFASFGECAYFTFALNSQMDEVCALFADDPQRYLNSCIFYGQPLYDSDSNELMEESCKNHSATPCGGFRSLDCLLKNSRIAHFQMPTKEDCAKKCRTGNLETCLNSPYLPLFS